MTEFISVPLKKPSDVDITKPLHNVIKSTYSTASNQKDYLECIIDLGKLRKNALWRAFEKYESSLEVIYRYYDQICVLESKIPANEVQIPFKWKDAFDRSIFGGKLSLTISSLAYEKVCVLFNIAALQSSVASTQSLESDEGLKTAAKLFQQSAGIFNYLKGNIMLAIQQEPTPDMSPETLEALSLMMLAQAQEIFTHKAIHDKMKDNIIAKLAAQTEELFSETFKLFQKEIFRAFWDKEWIPLITGKQLGYRGMSEYYQSLVCKNNKQIGEEIARLEFAAEMFKVAQTKSNRLTLFEDYYNKTLQNLTEVKRDNDFIYHERIPDFKSLSPVSKAHVAKLLPLPEKFSSQFQDIFADLLPMVVHNAISNYESRKSDLVNCEIAKLRNLRQLLNGTLASLNLPAAIEDLSGTELPQSLIDKATFIHEAGGIKTLEKTMNELPELLQRNKDILDEAERMLSEEEDSDNHLRLQFKERWTRLPSGRLTEQFKINSQKYRGIINNAISADKVVREKFEAHRQSVQILSMEPKMIANTIPTGSAIQESHVVIELRNLMKEAETLTIEQDSIECELQSVNVDMQGLFLSALIKDGVIDENNLITENLNIAYGLLQNKILEIASRQEKLIEAIQSKHMEFSKEQSSSGSSREQMLCKLALAYDAFKEIKNNLQEGVKFYNDLTQLLIIFQNKVSDFCFARKTEKEEILKDLTSNLSQTDASDSLHIPSHHKDKARIQVSSYLPYPTHDQGMPIPYGVQTSAPYPNYMPPPLPTTFNPYATMAFPTQDFNMPFFTIEFANSSGSCFFKADSLDDIITGTREKLELPNADYKVVLEDKKTKVDDDFIEYASQNPKEIMKLFMMTHDESHNINNNTKDKESIAPSDEAQTSTLNSTATSSKQLNLQSGVWNKVCPDLMDKILKGEMIEFTEKQQIVKKIAKYMVYLKDTKRGTAQKIAEIICKTYPRTFADKIEGVEWNDGIATLRTSILNCANYKTGTKKRKANMDNDEDENEVRRRERDNPRNQDEYGCTQYAPDLPSDENIKSQEERRLKLIDLFERLDHGQPEVLELMDKTYAMQRKSINDVTREISLLMTEWPFLTDDKCLIQHADKLMGKCILTTWKNSLEKKVKPIRQYLKTCHTLKINKSQELKDIIQDCKEATETRKDNYPKNAIIFPLLVLYFEENIELLYKIVDSALNEDAILEICANNNHPVLIIRGKTLYDSESTCTIILEGKTVIYCSDFLDGILLTFLSYYIFGYKYPAGLEKTLEFIQRILLQINPPIGTKTAPGKKRRTKSYNSAVFSLAKALSNFSDSFKTT